MQSIQNLVERASKTEHGFKDLEKAAVEVWDTVSATEAKKLAFTLLQVSLPQARCIGTFILGMAAARCDDALKALKEQARRDSDWRVQEIIAKAFDRFCADRGYETALPVIGVWLADPSANVRRAVTEGLRIWTGRPYFRDHPEVAVDLLSQFRNDDSEYLRKSVGNALRDISKRHPELVVRAVAGWNLDEHGTRQTHKLATRLLQSRLRQQRIDDGKDAYQ
ncbi:DNA alkylation repair protein [Jiella pacifica]|uniref:HEAT repeat domain-containing protein n=1 Tax=Jiella pacifica TaxID=2696469 RepID=A0A6N9T6K7_9HYPH|nr:HEAT repeat domain-containing protein [Jiella pacifica]NDW04548.1 HEAT repeat domain-containing protein [Jiella pacifica]